eukprot:4055993-Prymnesium_polylepis.2
MCAPVPAPASRRYRPDDRAHARPAQARESRVHISRMRQMSDVSMLVCCIQFGASSAALGFDEGRALPPAHCARSRANPACMKSSRWSHNMGDWQ